MFTFSKLELPETALKLAEQGNFELAGYKFDVQEEQLRKPCIVRIGAVQNKIVLPTSAPLANQVKRLYMLQLLSDVLVNIVISKIDVNIFVLFLIAISSACKNKRNYRYCSSVWSQCHLFSRMLE